MPMLMSTFWYHSQHQKWPFLNSNIYIWHQGACCEGDAQGWCLWTLFSLMRMLPRRNRLCFWKSHMDIMKRLTATFPPCQTHILVQILCRKWRDFHQELPMLKDNSTCNSVFPHQLSNSPNLRHSALRLVLSSKANSPVTVTCLRKKYWTWPSISSCLPEAAVPVVSEFPAPLLWCFPGSAQLLLPVHLLVHEGRRWNYPAKARAHNNRWNSHLPLRELFSSEILVSILKRDPSTVSHESWALKGIAFYWIVKGRALWAQGFSST